VTFNSLWLNSTKLSYLTF